MTANVTYYGKTKRHFKVRMSEHLGISSKTGKTVKTMHQTTAIYDHFLTSPSSSCSPTNFENFSILPRESNDFKLTLMERILIERDRHILNRLTKSMPFFLMFVTSFNLA